MSMILSFRLTASFKEGIVVGSTCRRMTLCLTRNYFRHCQWNRDEVERLTFNVDAHGKMIIRDSIPIGRFRDIDLSPKIWDFKIPDQSRPAQPQVT